MRPTPAPAEPLAAIPGLTAGVALILGNLAALVARAFLRHPVHVAHIVPLWGYINRTARRFARVMESLAAGRLRPHRPRPGRPARPRKPRGFPATRAWLLAALRHEAAGYGSQLRHLLEQPDSAALLAAAPQAARLLRPLCAMLGDLPAPLVRPRPPRRPRPPAEPRRPPASAAPEPARLLPRPPQPLCERLLMRWPFNAIPRPVPS